MFPIHCAFFMGHKCDRVNIILLQVIHQTLNMALENCVWLCALLCMSQVLSAPIKCQLDGTSIKTSYNLLKHMVHFKTCISISSLKHADVKNGMFLIISPCFNLGRHFPKRMHQGECPHNFSRVRFCLQWNRWGKSALSNLRPSPEAEGTNVSRLSPPAPRSPIIMIPFPPTAERPRPDRHLSNSARHQFPVWKPPLTDGVGWSEVRQLPKYHLRSGGEQQMCK